MIIWLTGNTGSGKTTLAKRMAKGQQNTVHLDGDEMRKVWPFQLGLDAEGRRANNIAVANLAKLLSDQGLCVVVSVIAPFEDLRREIETICGCVWIHMNHNEYEFDDERPYEPPVDPDLEVGW